MRTASSGVLFERQTAVAILTSLQHIHLSVEITNQRIHFVVFLLRNCIHTRRRAKQECGTFTRSRECCGQAANIVTKDPPKPLIQLPLETRDHR